MTMTNTIHPPGGATALLAIIDPTILEMGWIFVALILLGSVVMLLVALGINNLQRVFPVFWWTAADVGDGNGNDDNDVERDGKGKEGEGEAKIEQIENAGFRQLIVLSGSGVVMPEGFVLDGDEVQMMEVLRNRLREWHDGRDLGQEGERHFENGSDTTHVEYPGA